MGIHYVRMYSLTHFLRIFTLVFGAFGCPVAFIFGLFSVQLFITAVGSLLVSVPIFIVVQYCGEVSGNLLFGLGRAANQDARFKSDIHRARHLMATGKLDRANEVVELLLSMDPDLAEALFIQAQIMLRLGKPEAARPPLQHILRICPHGDPTRNWALNLLREMNEQEEKRG